jgi:site-specific recombinase XerD
MVLLSKKCPKSSWSGHQRMKDQIRPPFKVDRRGRRVNGDGKAHRWKLNVPASITGNGKLRLFFNTEKAAKQKREDLLANRKGLSDQQQQALADRGMTVEDAVAYAITHAPVVATVTMNKLLDDYRNNRTKEVGVSPRYLATLDSYLKKLREGFGPKNLRDVTRAQIRKFLENLKGRDGVSPASPDTYNHYLETLTAIFNYAKSERLLSLAPVDGLKKKAADEEAITILSVADVAKLLGALSKPEHAEVAPGVLLQIFGGVRRSELMHVEWEVVGEKYLRLDLVKRGTRKRAVEMPRALLDWIAPYRCKDGYVFSPAKVDAMRDHQAVADREKRKQALADAIVALESAYDWRLARAASDAGIKIPKNALRHTAITMRLQQSQDAAATSIWAGHDHATMEEHYLGIATPDDAARFYALRPIEGEVIPLKSITHTANRSGSHNKERANSSRRQQ